MEIRVTTYYGEYVYEVTATAVHEATDDTSYDFSRTDENLILYTCYPCLLYTSRKAFRRRRRLRIHRCFLRSGGQSSV